MKASFLFFSTMAIVSGCPVLVPPRQDDQASKPQQRQASKESRAAEEYIKSLHINLSVVSPSKVYALKMAELSADVSRKAKSGEYHDLEELRDDWSARGKEAMSSAWDEWKASEEVKAAKKSAGINLTSILNDLSGKDPSEDPAVSQTFAELAQGFERAGKK